MDTDSPAELDGVSPQFIAAIRDRAEIHADLAGKLINSTPAFAACRDCLPQFFILDLVAAAQLAEWERQGISAHTQAGLPSFKEAQQFMAYPHLRGGKYPGWLPEESLSLAVYRFAMERMSWMSQSEWGIDFVLGEVDEEEFLKAAEELIWDFFRDEIETASGGDCE